MQLSFKGILAKIFAWMRSPILPTDTDGISYAGTKSTYSMIKFKDHAADEYGQGIVIGGGGMVIVGSGESQDNVYAGLQQEGYSPGSEVMAIASDGEIWFFPNQQNGYNKTYQSKINTSGGYVTNRGAAIYLNSNTGRHQTVIYSYDSSGADCLMLQADGYIAVYVGTSSTAPTYRAYFEYAQTTFYHPVKATSFVNTSDKRLKKDIESIGTDELLLSLNPIKFRWKETEENQGADEEIHYGFVAQDVIESLKKLGYDPDECGVVQKDRDGYYALSYTEFIPMIVHLCQTQQKEIEALKKKIKS